MDGKVDAIHETQAYGWIKGEDGKRYFFHRTALTNRKMHELFPGDAVIFEPSRSEKGLRTDTVEAV